MENVENNVYGAYPRVKAVGKKLFWAFAIMYVVGALFTSANSLNMAIGVEKLKKDWNISWSFSELAVSMEPTPGKEVKLTFTDFIKNAGRPGGGGEAYLMKAFNGQNDKVGELADRVSIFTTLGFDNPSVSSEERVVRSLLFSFFSFVASALAFPLTILFFVLLFKAWKGLLPLKSLDKGAASRLLSPVLAVVLLFIPVVSYVWMFFALGRYPRLGKIMASHTGTLYRGPGKVLMWLYIFFYLGGQCLLLGFVLGCVSGLFLLSSVLLTLGVFTLVPLIYKLRDTVEDLASYEGTN